MHLRVFDYHGFMNPMVGSIYWRFDGSCRMWLRWRSYQIWSRFDWNLVENGGETIILVENGNIQWWRSFNQLQSYFLAKTHHSIWSHCILKKAIHHRPLHWADRSNLGFGPIRLLSLLTNWIRFWIALIKEKLLDQSGDRWSGPPWPPN